MQNGGTTDAGSVADTGAGAEGAEHAESGSGDAEHIAAAEEQQGTPQDTPDGGSEDASDAEPSEEVSDALEALSLDNLGDLAGRTVRVQIDGEDVDIPIEEALQGVMRQKAFTRKSQATAAELRKAQEMQKQAKDVFQLLRERPADVLRELGVDTVPMAEALIAEYLEDQQLTPEQRRLRELEQENEGFRKNAEKEQQTSQERAFQVNVEKHQADYADSIRAALEASPMGVTPYALKQVAFKLEAAIDAGVEVDPADIVAELAESTSTRRNEWLQSLTTEELITALGERSREIAQHHGKSVAIKQSKKLGKARSKPKDAPKSVHVMRSPDDWKSLFDS